MGAEFSKSAMAPGEWKLERLKHHHILVLLQYSWLNSERCLIAISAHLNLSQGDPTSKTSQDGWRLIGPEG